jgi:hypothetical protein
MLLIIGKKGKTFNVLQKYLDTEDSFFITDSSSLHGIKTITNMYLEREFPEEKEKNFHYISNCDLVKVNNLIISKRIRNCTLIVDSHLLLKHTLKEIKDFEFMNNLNLIMTFDSMKEEEIREIQT